MDTELRVITAATAVGCALNGGVFFAFSAFIMPGLDRLPAPQGVAAMQSLNVTAVTAPFMTLLFGTALAALALVVVGAVRGEPLLVAGGMVYLVGAIVITVAANVPLNDELAAARAADPATADFWSHFVSTWTAWNHVRTIAGLVAAGLLAAAAV